MTARYDQHLELLTTSEMAAADAATIQSGTAGLALMEAAGRAVADAAWLRVARGDRVVVVCGPGNNGGDGFVAARLLAERGCAVEVVLCGTRDQLRGDAAHMAARWTGAILSPPNAHIENAPLIIDALFGAGLTRPIDGIAACLVGDINRAREAGATVIAVDVPSGVDGSTGAAGPVAVRASETVTFFRRKPGHLMLPGRLLCGKVTVADIGIDAAVLAAIGPRQFANSPALWLAEFPWPRLDGHKYDRGHGVVVSGPAEMTGAARLAARAALRSGAGLVTLASPRAAFPVNAAHLTAVMVAPFTVPDGLADVLSDPRRNGVLLGPGLGIGESSRRMVEIVLASRSDAVLDADALTSYGSDADALAGLIKRRARGRVVVTPHDGELRRLMPDQPGACTGDRLARARFAALRLGAVVVLKGADTVVAMPDGRAAINENAPPWLATAGAGDVLAGLVLGLLVQGMPAFEAAAAAVWLHGACAHRIGPGLIAEDLPDVLPDVLGPMHDAAGRPGWNTAEPNGGIG
ncbi:MAG: NAD(P)H-hydrate dehydratase [Hyphomicrobiaceae bacterium]|nr:NAD(P)H-hydrate dehydratase [Hyphomicrobiaceae bacterium]